MTTKILVTGGAGYIGSHMCKYLFGQGYQPVILDNLSRGHRQAVKWGEFYKGSIADRSLLDKVFASHDIAAVMHFSAFAYVGESMNEPGKYYSNNVAATVWLLQAMVANGVYDFIFSSSCAVYGEPNEIPIPENHPKNPVNPYGRSKLMVEQILEDFSSAYGLRYISLRYFNAAGADPEGEIGEDHRPETHLIPLTLQTALGQRKAIEIFGDDYETRDGTCIRDYIHIDDLAQAHLLALERLSSGESGAIYNLGNAEGYSVNAVIDLARAITSRSIPAKVVGRRPGDPAVLVGSSEKAIQELGWNPRYMDLRDIIATAWNWHRKQPNGYVS
ncbi:UDP-glucose 4-epimerase GalE [Thermodesulfobacteriota bacterium]